ncbi:hypothetical protein MTP99_008769 [Tenebrio molitor]|nr:hypothetical protein MTP99_008769 [Tenebrio molitor]
MLSLGMVLLVVLSSGALPEADFTNELKKYRPRRNYTSCSYINVDLLSTRDVANSLIQENLCAGLVTGDVFNSTGYSPKTEAAFIFVEQISTIQETIRQVRNYSFWSARSDNHLIICKPLNDSDLLRDLLRGVWKSHIINFVVVFVCNSLQIVSYDPFKAQDVVNLTGVLDHFPDKLTNLHGHQLRVSLFDDFPLTMKRANRWSGKEYTLLATVAEMLNATVKIVEPPENSNYYGAYDDIMTDKADFCFVSHFQLGNIYQDAEFTYPHEMNGVALLMPVTHHTSKFLLVFHPTIWLLFVVVIVSISTMSLLRDRHSFPEMVLYTATCLLGYSFPRFDRKSFLVRSQIIIFIGGAIIIRTAFQSVLTSSFIKSTPVDQINSIAQLQKSSIKIFMSKPLGAIVPQEYNLHERFVYITREERIAMLYENLNTTGGYGMTLTYAQRYVEILKNRGKSTPFYVMKEILVPGYNTFIFQRHSPYIDKISECLLREKQYMLAARRRLAIKNWENDFEGGDQVVLRFQHLQRVFYTLACGLAASFLVFLTELTFYKFHYIFLIVYK